MARADELNLEGLKTNFQGEVIRPSDLNYESARKVWNGMIDKHPKIIARCSDENDVIKAVKFAAENKLTLAIRGGGHNVAGFGTCDNGIVIDLSLMKKITVNLASRTASAQGGLTWGEFDRETQKYSLATTGGLVSSTGIGGFTLGGGIGWLMREHGLTLDNLLSVEMITAGGRLVKASEKENRDLFWGIRGGGGNFGVVTTFNFQLHPVGPIIYGGAVFHTMDKAKELLLFYGEWVKTHPDKLTSMIAFITAPPAHFIPQNLQGKPVVAVALCYNGDAMDGELLIRPLRAFAGPAVDLIGPVPYTQLQTMFDEGAPSGLMSYWKTEYLQKLDQNTIDALVEYASKMESPLSQVHIQHLEGKVARKDEESTAYSHRKSPFVLNIVGIWNNPEENEKHIAWTRKFAEAIKHFSTGAVYLNFLGEEGETRIKAAYGEKKYRHLVELKNKYDPKNLFCVNQNIKPSVE